MRLFDLSTCVVASLREGLSVRRSVRRYCVFFLKVQKLRFLFIHVIKKGQYLWFVSILVLFLSLYCLIFCFLSLFRLYLFVSICGLSRSMLWIIDRRQEIGMVLVLLKSQLEYYWLSSPSSNIEDNSPPFLLSVYSTVYT